MNKPTKLDAPAMPQEAISWCPEAECFIKDSTRLVAGLTKREQAAIHLCVPMSGDAELDAMIRRSLLQRYAGEYLAGVMANAGISEMLEGMRRKGTSNPIHCQTLTVESAVDYAKAMVAELERSAK